MPFIPGWNDLHTLPTGQTAPKYNVVIKDLKAKFFEVADYDQPYRMEVELILSIRSVNTDP